MLNIKWNNTYKILYYFGVSLSLIYHEELKKVANADFIKINLYDKLRSEIWQHS